MPLRLRLLSLMTKPSGRTRWNCAPAATQSRPMLPVLGAICGCISTTFNACGGSAGPNIRHQVSSSDGEDCAETLRHKGAESKRSLAGVDPDLPLRLRAFTDFALIRFRMSPNTVGNVRGAFLIAVVNSRPETSVHRPADGFLHRAGGGDDEIPVPIADGCLAAVFQPHVGE